MWRCHVLAIVLVAIVKYTVPEYRVGGGRAERDDFFIEGLLGVGRVPVCGLGGGGWCWRWWTWRRGSGGGKMNPDTGHLVALLGDETMKEGYYEIPTELTDEARRELAGRKEIYIDLEGGSPLSQWAIDKRRCAEKKKAHNRRRRKMARQRK